MQIYLQITKLNYWAKTRPPTKGPLKLVENFIFFPKILKKARRARRKRDQGGESSSSSDEEEGKKKKKKSKSPKTDLKLT